MNWPYSKHYLKSLFTYPMQRPNFVKEYMRQNKKKGERVTNDI